MKVQIVYVDSESEWVLDTEVEKNATVQTAILKSGILVDAKISLDDVRVGIFGDIVSIEKVLNSGDRIQIYRSLRMDPMEARRLRATTVK